MRLIDIEPLQKEQWYLYRYVTGVYGATIEQMELEKVPTVDAVPLDKLCELCEEIDTAVPDTAVPCVLCEKMMPEWCKENNHPPMTWDKGWKCPTWKQLLTKWMEKQDAALK